MKLVEPATSVLQINWFLWCYQFCGVFPPTKNTKTRGSFAEVLETFVSQEHRFALQNFWKSVSTSPKMRQNTQPKSTVEKQNWRMILFWRVSDVGLGEWNDTRKATSSGNQSILCIEVPCCARIETSLFSLSLWLSMQENTFGSADSWEHSISMQNMFFLQLGAPKIISCAPPWRNFVTREISSWENRFIFNQSWVVLVLFLEPARKRDVLLDTRIFSFLGLVEKDLFSSNAEQHFHKKFPFLDQSQAHRKAGLGPLWMNKAWIPCTRSLTVQFRPCFAFCGADDFYVLGPMLAWRKFSSFHPGECFFSCGLLVRCGTFWTPKNHHLHFLKHMAGHVRRRFRKPSRWVKFYWISYFIFIENANSHASEICSPKRCMFPASCTTWVSACTCRILPLGELWTQAPTPDRHLRRAHNGVFTVHPPGRRDSKFQWESMSLEFARKFPRLYFACVESLNGRNKSRNWCFSCKLEFLCLLRQVGRVSGWFSHVKTSWHFVRVVIVHSMWPKPFQVMIKPLIYLCIALRCNCFFLTLLSLVITCRKTTEKTKLFFFNLKLSGIRPIVCEACRCSSGKTEAFLWSPNFHRHKIHHLSYCKQTSFFEAYFRSSF